MTRCASGAEENAIRLDWAKVSNFPVLLWEGHAIVVGYHPHDGTDLMSVDLVRHSVAWSLSIPAAAVARHEPPIVHGRRMIITGNGVWVTGLDQGRILLHRDLRFPEASGTVAGDILVLVTGDRRLSALRLDSLNTDWTALVDSEIVSNVVSRGRSLYVLTRAGMLHEIDAASGRVTHRIPLRTQAQAKRVR